MHLRSKGGYSVRLWKEIREEGSLLRSKIVFSIRDG